MNQVEDRNGPVEPHLTDETLSSYIDETLPEQDADLEAHLSRCARCKQRLASMRAANEMVASPVEPVPAARKASIVAAAVGSGTEVGPTHDRRARSGLRKAPVLVGAAAAVVALAVALPLALSSGGSSPVPSSAGRSLHSTSARSGLAKRQPPASTAGPLVQLGRVGSLSELLGRLRASTQAIPGAEQGAAGAAQPFGNDQAASGAASGASTGSSTTSVAPPDVEHSRCVSRTRTEVHGGPSGPGVVATATFKGRNSLVIEFWTRAAPPPPGRSVVAVVSAVGCRLLARSVL